MGTFDEPVAIRTDGEEIAGTFIMARRDNVPLVGK